MRGGARACFAMRFCPSPQGTLRTALFSLRLRRGTGIVRRLRAESRFRSRLPLLTSSSSFYPMHSPPELLLPCVLQSLPIKLLAVHGLRVGIDVVVVEDLGVPGERGLGRA